MVAGVHHIPSRQGRPPKITLSDAAERIRLMYYWIVLLWYARVLIQVILSHNKR